jgi:hypothetical protein
MLMRVYEGVVQSQGRPELAVDSDAATSRAVKNPGVAHKGAKKSFNADSAKNPTSPQIVV